MPHAEPIPQIARLEEISGAYDVILSDIWGVLHDGLAVYPSARAALERARAAGKTVILITNSPRPGADVRRQIAGLGLPPRAYDGLVTSGDTTRALIADAPKKLFHIGPERDLSLFDGLDCELAEEPEAQAVVCTGLFAEQTEQPEDYRPLLQRLRGRNLPFICANPDVIVHIGGRQLWCAGALAQIYTRLGGRTLISGKPHKPIYQAALARAAAARSLRAAGDIDKSRVLAIGDGIMTDIKGADSQGLDCLFIANGIHIGEYSGKNGIDAEKLSGFIAKSGYAPRAFMPQLA